ncbi:MAG: FKBP-type peptidyl-prolyl cis-trans isomerase [Bacteroidales bacterium]|nr:FKBP-type peptidyl-prolyl cis-trans isomerase [Bacteroidales bacterium]
MKKNILFSLLLLIVFGAQAQSLREGFQVSDTKVIYKADKQNPNGRKVKENDMVFARYSISMNDNVVADNTNQKPSDRPAFFVSKDNNMFKGDLMDGLLLMREKEDYTFAFPKDSMLKIQQVPQDFQGYVYYRVIVDSICSYEEFTKAQAEVSERLRKEENEKIEAYLSENNWDKSSVEGIYCKPVKQGSGPKAKQGDVVKVNYTGQLLDAKIFDTSVEDVAKENNLYDSRRKYEPLEFQIGAGQMIQGFEIAARQMNKGSVMMVLLPSALAYGDRDMGIISPYSPLVFTMEMVDIQEGAPLPSAKKTAPVKKSTGKTNTTKKKTNKK